MAKAPRKIDKIIEDIEAEEVAAAKQIKGGKNLALCRKIQAQTARDIKAELVGGNDLPDTPDPVRPLAAAKAKAKKKRPAKSK